MDVTALLAYVLHGWVLHPLAATIMDPDPVNSIGKESPTPYQGTTSQLWPHLSRQIAMLLTQLIRPTIASNYENCPPHLPGHWLCYFWLHLYCRGQTLSPRRCHHCLLKQCGPGCHFFFRALILTTSWRLLPFGLQRVLCQQPALIHHSHGHSHPTSKATQ